MSSSASVNAEDQPVSFTPASELLFVKKEDGDYASTTLKIQNKSQKEALLFRIQTTSPLAYRVRPSHGRIGPEEGVDVTVVMVQESKKSDKFLIRYAAVGPAAVGEFGEQFASVEALAREHRIRCVIQGSPLTQDDNRSINTIVGPALEPVTPLTEQQPSPSTASSPEDLQRELTDARQQVRELARRNQELSQRLAAVEQSGIRLRDIAGASKPAISAEGSGLDRIAYSNPNLPSPVESLEPTILDQALQYYESWNRLVESVLPNSLRSGLVVLLLLFAYLLGLTKG